MNTYTVDNVTYTVGDTVRCTHNDNGECRLCREMPSACGYRRIKQGGIGTILDVNDSRIPHFRTANPQGPHSIIVAFLGNERPSIMPLDQIALVSDTPEDRLDMWQFEMDEISRADYEEMVAYDNAPDGSRAKQRAMNHMDYLSLRRRLVESVFAVLIP